METPSIPLRKTHAFTLVELLTVLGILGLMLTLVGPAISGGSAPMSTSVTEIAATLEQARQYAIAQNTYVWVAFNPIVDDSVDTSLDMAVVASKTGVDPVQWSEQSTYASVPNSDIQMIGKARSFSNLTFGDAGSSFEGAVPSLPSTTPAIDSSNSPAAASLFDVKLPGSGAPVAFRRFIQFTPNGEARNGASPINVVEFSLKAARGSGKNNVAIFRISGLTGQTVVYRP